MDKSSKGQPQICSFVNYSFETDQFQEIDVQKMLTWYRVHGRQVTCQQIDSDLKIC